MEFVSSLVSWLIGGMKQLLCAVIYWMFYWVWPWFEWALDKLPTEVTSFPAKVLDEAIPYYQLTNVFMPVQEALLILIGYWTVMLAFRLFHVVDQIKAI